MGPGDAKGCQGMQDGTRQVQSIPGIVSVMMRRGGKSNHATTRDKSIPFDGSIYMATRDGRLRGRQCTL